MKIRMSFGVAKTVIIVIVLAGVLAIAGLDIALLAGAKGLYAASPAIPAVSLVAAALIGAASLLILFNSYYGFKDKGIVIILGFFADKVAYDDFVVIKQNIDTGELFAIVNGKSPSEPQVGLKINVSVRKTDAFLQELRKHIPNITVDFFSQPKNKNKQK